MSTIANIYLVSHGLPHKLVDVTGEISIFGVVDSCPSILYQTPEDLNTDKVFSISPSRHEASRHPSVVRRLVRPQLQTILTNTYYSLRPDFSQLLKTSWFKTITIFRENDGVSTAAASQLSVHTTNMSSHHQPCEPQSFYL